MQSTDTALYRKYRPQTFREVVGQEHIVRVLEGAIAEKQIAHAYLFSGSRGTGKTSVARIFARAIGTADTDVYEIDAASNRGIDDVRALREGVSTIPFSSPYKVYIVDEVHMLTKEAFNALLKTLEEPPPHAVFILATTELEKVPETIISRCQTFTFKKPAVKVLRDVVLRVAKEEGYKLDSAGAELIALLGDGSFRDTLGMLQKVIGFSKDTTISVEEIEQVTGAPRGELVNAYVSAFAQKNIEQGLTTVRKASDAGVALDVFLKLALEKLRAILLVRFAPKLRDELAAEYTDHDMQLIEQLAKDGKGLGSHTLLALLTASRQLQFAQDKAIPLELALMTELGEE
jgi:DNA polymerase III subunit gamma/tau